MFANAYAIASQFTRPVITSLRYFNKIVETSVGAYVVLNQEGWAVTAGHVMTPLFVHQQHSQEFDQYQAQVNSIQQNPKLNGNEKRQRINKLTKNPKWLTHFAYSFNAPGVQMRDINVIPDADIAIGRLEPFDPTEITNYPVIKNPSNLPYGRSLCKLGYPFFTLDSSFDESLNMFRFSQEAITVPFFPIDGIFTRTVEAGKTSDGAIDVKFIETSSPGLRGQSGGPIFDSHGQVWGIQSRTIHFPLGFNPKITVNGREIEEHQFLNVGVGLHPETLIAVLKSRNIQFQLSDD